MLTLDLLMPTNIHADLKINAPAMTYLAFQKDKRQSYDPLLLQSPVIESKGKCLHRLENIFSSSMQAESVALSKDERKPVQ
jgi:hypothetical protein